MTRTDERAPGTRSGRDFRLLLGAFVVSMAGDWLYKLALPLMVLQLTGSAVQTAIVYSLEYLPYLIFAPIAGVIADRYDRRRTLIRTDLCAAAVLAVLAAFTWFDRYHLWMIYLAAFVLSLLTPLYQATFQGLVPSTVPADRLSRANSRMELGRGTLDLAGPLLGAGVVAVVGVQWALTLDSASFGLSALAIALIARGRPRPRTGQHGTIVGDLTAAVVFVRTHSPLLWGAVVAAGSAFGLFMVEANMITYLVRFREQPIASVGVVFAALGVGALAGAMLAPRLLDRFGFGMLIIAATIGGGCATALLLVLHQLVAIVAIWVVVGGSTTVFIVTFFTLRHRMVPDQLLGRVVIVTRLISFGLLPLAPIVGGYLMSATDAFWPVLALSATVQIGVGLMALLTPLRTVVVPESAQE